MASARDLCRQLARTEEYKAVVEREDSSSVDRLVEIIDGAVIRTMSNTIGIDLANGTLTSEQKEKLGKLSLGIRKTLKQFYEGLGKNIEDYIPAMQAHYSGRIAQLSKFICD